MEMQSYLKPVLNGKTEIKHTETFCKRKITPIFFCLYLLRWGRKKIAITCLLYLPPEKSSKSTLLLRNEGRQKGVFKNSIVKVSSFDWILKTKIWITSVFKKYSISLPTQNNFTFNINLLKIDKVYLPLDYKLFFMAMFFPCEATLNHSRKIWKLKHARNDQYIGKFTYSIVSI